MDNVVTVLGSLQRSVDAMRSEFTQALDAQRVYIEQALREHRAEFREALTAEHAGFSLALQHQRTDFQQGLRNQNERIDALIYEMARERRWVIGYIMANSGLLLGVLLRNYF